VLAQQQPDCTHAREKGDLSEMNDGKARERIRLAEWPAININHATLNPEPLILEARPDSSSTLLPE